MALDVLGRCPRAIHPTGVIAKVSKGFPVPPKGDCAVRISTKGPSQRFKVRLAKALDPAMCSQLTS
jgi:hypothetical protein